MTITKNDLALAISQKLDFPQSHTLNQEALDVIINVSISQ